MAYLAGHGRARPGKTLLGANWVIEQALRHPDSEWGVFAPTFRDVRKTCIEGSTGILAQLQPGEQDTYRRNELQLILSNGSTIYGYSADQPERVRGANLWGAWCVARGEPVLTSLGLVPIESVHPGMNVWTRKGWRRVTAQCLTKRSAPVVRVTTADGASVRLTPDHRVWTQQHGWVEARALRYGDILSVWNSPWDRLRGSNGKASAGTDAVAEQDTTRTARDASSTWPCGSESIVAAFPAATSCTTSTTTWPTTNQQTCSCSLAQSTYTSTTSNNLAVLPLFPPKTYPAWRPVPGPTGPCASTCAQCAAVCSCRKASGQNTAHHDAKHLPSELIIVSAAVRLSLSASANGAVADSFPGIAERCIAEAPAGSGQVTPLSAPAPVSGLVFRGARSAAPSSLQRTVANASAPIAARSGTHVVRVEPAGLADVFDLQVDDAHEFTAGGILVHNCEELGSWRYQATWYEGLVPALRKGENPRIVITATPRATGLIKDLASRTDGSVHITRGSTWENAANLSAAAIDELKRRYEGTRLGRQELEGELLTDVEGALWTLDDIDATRIRPDAVPDLTRVVVSVDPAVTSAEGSDETGIMIVGEANGHGYVLADLSMRGTPDACMRKAVWAYTEFHADCVVAEVNNGGDYIASLLKTVDANVPCRTVRASRGKAVRAEPVSALYEQKRVHHVGVFAQLEDQMTQWVPSDPESPDRVDALVWAVTELRGLSVGSWYDAYGVAECEECGKPSARVAGRLRCPHCGAAIPDVTESAGAWMP